MGVSPETDIDSGEEEDKDEDEVEDFFANEDDLIDDNPEEMVDFWRE